MKFALLVASAAAIQLRVAEECVSQDESGEIFKQIDTNDNGQVNRKELVTALKAYAKQHNYKPTKKDWAWVAKTAYADAGKDKQLDPAEFHKWVNQFAHHFHIDGCGN